MNEHAERLRHMAEGWLRAAEDVEKYRTTREENEEKAARLEEMAANREADSRGLHGLAQKLGLSELQKQKAVTIAMADADAALLREAAAMMRERKTVEWDAESGSTKNGLHLFAGPVLSGFISLVTKQGQMLYMDWHPTLEAARAAAVAWVDGEARNEDMEGKVNVLRIDE